MGKKEAFSGLEEARKEFNGWQGNAVLFIDFEDRTAWTRVSEIPRYESESIIALIRKDDFYERNHTYSAATLDGLLKQIEKARQEGCENFWSKTYRSAGIFDKKSP